MKTLHLLFSSLLFIFSPCVICAWQTRDSLVLTQSETLRYATLVNDYFMRTYPDVGAKSYVGNKERTSKIWTRGVYYEGLMSLYRQHQDERWLKYTEDWGNHHGWKASEKKQERHADFQCCGQAYLDMYMLNPAQTVRKTHIKKLIDDMLATNVVDDWYWVDAVQMAMPIFAQLGTIEKDERYFRRMYEMYMFTRNQHGGSKKSGGLPLFNTEDGLWYRDKRFAPPYKEPNGRDCYWSRGNGWAYAALARVMNLIPRKDKHYKDYLKDFLQMSKAIKLCQREDGFWNVSLHDPGNFGGKEGTGTALFVYGLAWGIRNGILDRDEYLPMTLKAWNALVKDCMHPNGALGYMQGRSNSPKAGQPLTYDCIHEPEDFAVGCFLLAASEIYKLK